MSINLVCFIEFCAFRCMTFAPRPLPNRVFSSRLSRRGRTPTTLRVHLVYANCTSFSVTSAWWAFSVCTAFLVSSPSRRVPFPRLCPSHDRWFCFYSCPHPAPCSLPSCLVHIQPRVPSHHAAFYFWLLSPERPIRHQRIVQSNILTLCST